MAGPTTPVAAPTLPTTTRTAVVVARRPRALPVRTVRQGQLGAYDELGFSFNPLKIVSNVAKAVTKGVSDVAAEAKRAANNPLVQTAVNFVPGVGPLAAKGLAIAGSIGNSKIGTAAAALNQATAGATSVGQVAGRLASRFDPALQGPNGTIARAAAERDAAAAREVAAANDRAKAAEAALEAARVAKVAEGERIQAENAQKSAAAAAAQKAKRDAKAAEGARIQAANKAAADKKAADDALAATQKKLKQATRAAAELQKKADAAAAAGNSGEAAAIRLQADAVTQSARAVSVSSGAADAAQLPAAGPVYTAPVQGPGAEPAGIAGIPKPVLYGGGALLVLGGLYAVTHGGGAHRSWR